MSQTCCELKLQFASETWLENVITFFFFLELYSSLLPLFSLFLTCQTRFPCDIIPPVTYEYDYS